MGERRTDVIAELLPRWAELLQGLSTLISSPSPEDNAFFIYTEPFNLHDYWLQWIETQSPPPVVLHLDQAQAPQGFSKSLQDSESSVFVILGLESRPDPQGILIKLAQLKEKTCPTKHFAWVIGINQAIAPLFRDMQSFLGGTAQWIEFSADQKDLDNLIQTLLTEFWLDYWQLWLPETVSRLAEKLEKILFLIGENWSQLSPLAQASLHLLKGVVQENQGKYALAVQCYQSSLNLWQTLPLTKENQSQNRWLILRLAATSYRQARLIGVEGNHPLWKQIRSYLQLGLEALEAIHWQDLRPDSFTLTAEILCYLEDWDKLRQLAEQCLVFYYQIAPSDGEDNSQTYPGWTEERVHAKIAWAYLYMGEALMGQWRFSEAWETVQKAVECVNRYPDNHWGLSGWLYYLLGRSQLGENHLFQAIQSLELAKQFAKEDQDTDRLGLILINLRECYHQQEDVFHCIQIDQEYQALEYQRGQRLFIGLHPLFPVTPVTAEDDPRAMPIHTWLNHPQSQLLLFIGETKSGKSSVLQFFSHAIKQPILWIQTLPTIFPKLDTQIKLPLVIIDLGLELANLLVTSPQDTPFWDWLAALFKQSGRVIFSLSPDGVASLLHHLSAALFPQDLPSLTYYPLPILTDLQAWQFLNPSGVRNSPFDLKLLKTLLSELTNHYSHLYPVELQILGSELEAQSIIRLEQYVSPGKQRLLQSYIQRLVAIANPDQQVLIHACLACLAAKESSPLLTFETLLEQSTTPRELTLTSESLERILTILKQAGLIKVSIIEDRRYFQISTPDLAQAVREIGFRLQAIRSRSTQPAFKSQELDFQLELSELEADPSAISVIHDTQTQYQQLLAALRIERQCAVILKQFESQPLEALLLALHRAQELQKDHPKSPPLEKYTTIAPFHALQLILSQIYERNRLQHRNSVSHIQFSPNGQFLATGSSDGKVRVWTIAGKKIATLRGHQAPITDLQWSPDSAHLLTAADNQAKLWEYSGHVVATLRGHDDCIRSVQFHPYQKLLLSAARDKTIRLWDYEGHQVGLGQGHQGWVRRAQFSPGGEMIASASRDGTARLWDLGCKEVVCLHGHKGWVRNAQFSPEGEILVTASVDGTARLWDLSGKGLGVLNGHQNGLRNAQFSPDGQQIITASMDGTARLWDRQGKLTAILQGHKTVQEALFSPNSQWVITTGGEGTVMLWSRKGKALLVLRSHQKEVYHADFHPNSQMVGTVSADHTARLWDLSDKGGITLRGHTHWVRSAHFSKKGDRLLTASRDKTARLWDEAGHPIVSLEGHQGWVRDAQFSPDGHLIATASADYTAQVWNVLGKKMASLRGHQEAVLTVCFSPNGQYLLTASKDKTAKIWNTSGQCLTTLRKHDSPIFCAEFSTDGQFIVTATGDGQVTLWDIVGREMATCRGHGQAVYSAQFSFDSHWLLTASGDQTARLWDMSGREIAVFKGHRGTVYQAQFSPDEQLIATAGEDHTARLWDRKGKELAVLFGHQGLVSSVQWSRDGQLLVTASEDGTARVWDRQGRELAMLQGHHSWVRTAEFSPDRRFILTASTDGTAKLWPLADLSTLLNKGCEWVQDYLDNNPLVEEEDKRLCEEGKCMAWLSPQDETNG